MPPEREAERTEKAEIAKLGSDGQPAAGTKFKVQFNPATLRIQTRNNVEGGRTSGRVVRSQNGLNPTTLTVELIFDTADEAKAAPRDTEEPESDEQEEKEPIDVQLRTAQLKRFVEPQGRGSRRSADPIWFHWGNFFFTGVVESMDEELELFSFYGVPLRAKVTLTIKLQDRRLEANEAGAGSRENEADDGDADGGGETDEGDTAASGSGKPGTSGGGKGDTTDQAIAGESAADFASRHGLPAKAWRAITNADIPDPLNLPGGLEIPFPSSVGATAGVGVRGGVGAGLGLSAQAGMRAAVGLAGRGRSRDERMALGAAGGMTAALDATEHHDTEAASAAERTAFPTPANPPTAARSAGATTSGGARAAAELPRPDPRATASGRGCRSARDAAHRGAEPTGPPSAQDDPPVGHRRAAVGVRPRGPPCRSRNQAASTPIGSRISADRPRDAAAARPRLGRAGASPPESGHDRSHRRVDVGSRTQLGARSRRGRSP